MCGILGRLIVDGVALRRRPGIKIIIATSISVIATIVVIVSIVTT
jgi:hypothetical protein